MSTTIHQNSLVLYKSRPAHVLKISDKLEIKVNDGKTLKVRLKDVTLLHPGPMQSLGGLAAPSGDIETAWELLAGETTTLPELAELIYDEFTPATAWSTWQLIDEGLYFKGTLEAVEVQSAEVVAQMQESRAAKAAEKEAWAVFLNRLGEGRIEAEDGRYLTEVEQVALGQMQKSRVLRELGRNEEPEQAHSLLLQVGYWDETRNPYPERFELETTSPELTLPALPDEDRLDLTHLPAFAIDDEGSTDPDDAISLDGKRLWVHVADVAALIPPDSPADLEARARGANLYLPERTIHMLPEATTDILALGLSDVSPALSFGMDLSDSGEVLDLVIAPSWIKVERLSYESAEARLTEEPLKALHQIAQQARARRIANGSVEIDLPEVKVRVKEAGAVVIKPILNLKSRDVVREAMLLAGEAVARFAQEADIPFPYTSQDFPDEPDTERPEGMAGMFSLRLSMKPGQVKTVAGPHAGLGLDIYTRVTSPLRRYSDLIAHQQLRAYLRGGELLDEQTMIERVGTAEAMGGSVRRAERMANRHWTLVYFMQNPEWEGEGVVLEKRKFNDTIVIPTLDFEFRKKLRQNPSVNTVLPLTLMGVNLPSLDATFRLRS